MSDETIVARFMEPKPPGQPIMWDELSNPRSPNGWWGSKQAGEPGNYHMEWVPCSMLSLDTLRRVEAKLSDEQWDEYVYQLDRQPLKGWKMRRMIHLSAEEKLKALASVLPSEEKS